MSTNNQATKKGITETIRRAIDLGYGNTKFTKSFDPKLGYDYQHFPSFTPKASMSDLSGGIAGTRDTRIVDVDGAKYEVGPDSRIASGTRSKRVLHDDYINQPQYMALTKGALSYMDVPEVDILVVGLPVTLSFGGKKDALVEMMTGEHELDNGKKITIKRTIAIPQPMGGLFAYMQAAGNDAFEELKSSRNLIVDVGYFTFDFLYSIGFKPNENRSGDDQSGMSRILEAVAAQVGKDLNIDGYDDLDAVDEGLRKGKVKIYGKEVDFTPYITIADTVAKDAVSTMKNRVGDGRDIDQIVLCGGGAPFYLNALKAAYPHHADGIKILEDSMLSNVKGFQAIADMKASQG